MESEELLIGSEEGLFERLDWAAIGGRDHYIPQAVSDFGVGAILYSFVLAWDRARLQTAPRGWADFFDTPASPAAARCARGRRRRWRSRCWPMASPPAISIARSAPRPAWTAPSAGSTASKANLAWWERGSQPPQWLASGEVALTNAYNGRISAANANDSRDFGIAWDQNLYTLNSWVIMRGSPNRQRALDFLRSSARRRCRRGCRRRSPMASPRAAPMR